jgi:hypothetical protein
MDKCLRCVYPRTIPISTCTEDLKYRRATRSPHLAGILSSYEYLQQPTALGYSLVGKTGVSNVCRAITTGLAIVTASIFVTAAAAERRVALVVGNDRYENLPADQQLQRAANDARAVGEALGRLGFSVLQGENLKRQALIDKFAEMAGQLGAGDTAFFFFAGHGVSIDGANYILPTDIPDVSSPGQEARLRLASLSETEIASTLKGRGVRVAVIVLDACRNNPFRRPGGRAIGGERGLVRSDPVRGVFSLYSAGAGQTALDRLGRADTDSNSVFTRVLVPALAKPGRDLSALAVEVREEVAQLAGTVGHEQYPAYYDEIIGGRVYLAGRPPTNSAPEDNQGPGEAERAWISIRNTTSVSLLEEFMRRYPGSFYAAQARARIEELKKPQIPVAVPEVKKPEVAVAVPEPTWDHNGSIMRLESAGSQRRFYYLRPRPGVSEQGVRPGTLLFSGNSSGGQYQGTAYIFDRRCGSVAYQVSGPISNGARRVTMRGQAPNQFDSNCRVVAYRNDVLEFHLNE